MNRNIELLAPGGDVDSIKAAIVAGADAIYCGLNKFNARNRAENITIDNLNGILHLAHQNNCEIFLTLNIGITEPEIPDLIRLLNKLVNTSIDGVIVQDLGLFYILLNYFKRLKIHASTQLTTHNEGQIKFLSKLNATRVNLSRELNVAEVKHLSTTAHQHNMLSEVFVHGSYCISFSGICYMSSVHGGNSGNRGRCSQPCRDEYETTQLGNRFPLNLKDNSAWVNLSELAKVGVDSLKIEGRIKKFHYVYSVVDAYRKQLRSMDCETSKSYNNSILHKVFNRDFSNAFLTGDIDRDMFIDNPRDNSALHFARKNGGVSAEDIEKAERALYAERGELRESIQKKIEKLRIEKAPLQIHVSGSAGNPLCVSIQTPENSFVFYSDKNLATKGTSTVDEEMLLKRFKAINETEYYIAKLILAKELSQLYIPFKEITTLKNRILLLLNSSRETVEAIAVPGLTPQKQEILTPELLVLINSEEDIDLCEQALATFCFQLPNDFTNQLQKLIELFAENRKLIPWFPSIIIGENFSAALEFLRTVQPAKIVTNNTGIAYEANKMGISWIAGPFLNTMNSFALQCLKEHFNCVGAFISNELSKQQIQRIKKPADFKLYYSIYHPLVLMTSRQCFFQTTTGCEKNKMDKHCLPNCAKSTSIKNLKGETFFIKKSKSNLNRVYNAQNFLNAEIVDDIPNRFSGFLIDLRDINVETKIALNKTQLISLFINHIHGESGLKQELHSAILNTTNAQYQQGI